MRVRVTAPATAANLGPGFDTLGMALDFGNELELEEAEQESVVIEGEGADTLPRTAGHLTLQAARKVYELCGRTAPALALRQVNRIPLARGLGSSAAAVVGGLVAANRLLGGALGREDVLDIAAALEGHPDNAAPCLLGGLVAVAGQQDKVLVTSLTVNPPWEFVLAVPDLMVHTETARRRMPAQVALGDAVFTLSRLAVLIGGLAGGDRKAISAGLEDRIHQPVRGQSIPGFVQVREAAIAAGALGAVISGSGPTVLAVVDPGAGGPVGQAMEQAFAGHGVAARIIRARMEHRGAWERYEINN